VYFLIFFFFFFFFQAEDGIRDRTVTGVQTCALPIYYSYMHYVPVDNLPTINLNGGGGAAVLYFAGFFGIKAEFEGYASENVNFRSEERRVGKECRFWW